MDDQSSSASSAIKENNTITGAGGQASNTILDVVLKEVITVKLKEIREDINGTKRREEEVEERIVDAETQIRVNEEADAKLMKGVPEEKLSEYTGLKRLHETFLHRWVSFWKIYYDQVS